MFPWCLKSLQSIEDGRGTDSSHEDGRGTDKKHKGKSVINFHYGFTRMQGEQVFFWVLWALYTGRHTYAKLTQAYAE